MICRSNHGTSFYHDKSVAFYRNPRGFVDDHCSDGDERVFVCRLLTRPCLVIGSNALVRTFLEECVGGGKTYNGLKDFFFGLFGNSILFSTDPSEVDHLRYFSLFVAIKLSISFVSDVCQLRKLIVIKKKLCELD